MKLNLKNEIGKTYLLNKKVEHLGIDHSIGLYIESIEKIHKHLFKVTGIIVDKYVFKDGSSSIVKYNSHYIGKHSKGCTITEIDKDQLLDMLVV